MTALRIGTRASALALAQTTLVAQGLQALGQRIELVEITTVGDRSTVPISQLGGVGVFTSALRDALRSGEINIAVHSYKDLPTATEHDLVIAAIPPREDPADVLITRDRLSLTKLPTGATIGTGAPRRVAQLRAVRPDLNYVPLRGNVDTRLRKVFAGELDGVVLARAGLARLHRLTEVTETLSFDVVLPAPAQGALAVECLADKPALVSIVEQLDDPETRASVTAERSLLARLEAGCSAPVGAFAECCEVFNTRHVHLEAAVIAIDGTKAIRRRITGPLRDTTAAAVADATAIGERLAADLLAAGAAGLVTDSAQQGGPLSRPLFEGGTS